MGPTNTEDMQRVLLYDGVCALCNGLVRFVLKRDRRDVYRFAPLQSAIAAEILERHGRDPTQLNTMYLIHNYGTPREKLSSRGRGALRVLRGLGGRWRACIVLEVLPSFVLNLGYHIVARSRYRLFGRLETCPVPPPEHRAKFLA